MLIFLVLNVGFDWKLLKFFSYSELCGIQSQKKVCTNIIMKYSVLKLIFMNKIKRFNRFLILYKYCFNVILSIAGHKSNYVLSLSLVWRVSKDI